MAGHGRNPSPKCEQRVSGRLRQALSCAKRHFIYMGKRGKYQFYRRKRQWKKHNGRLLIGLERPTSGEILLDGENIAKWSYGQWRSHRTKIQAVFQDATGSLNRRLSVGHNLEEALRNLTKLSFGERKQRILELMDLTATSRKLLDTPTKNLSGGEQRRVALLRALAVRPDYLILDELTSGLDLISQKAIREVLEAYHREYRCSYFLITHDMKFAYRLSQRIYELESGQIVNIGQSNIDINLQERK